jgi:hypothetical protein
MKKLFLTSFVFDTGDLKDIKEYRMVVVTGKEVAQPGRAYYDLAYEKAGKWFEENYPESKLKVLVAHQAIE